MSSRAFEVDQSDAEEIANSLTHAIGVGLSLASLPMMVAIAVSRGDPWRLVGASVFGTTLVLLYSASSFYHACRPLEAKRLLNKLDHASIFLLIAGSYTPFTLVTLRGPWGWSLFGFVWSCALVGVALTIFFEGRFKRTQLAMYLAMGWVVVVAIVPLWTRLPSLGLWWLFLGGLLYSGGVPFYLAKNKPFRHTIWHLFVLGGSICHFWCVYRYVLSGIA